ncbi:MAG TPA: hypothetical protein VGF94_24035 [Kofleriaceae bacterium]
MPEADNDRRWADGAPAYEVWYATWNDPRTGAGYWLRYLTEPGRGELWFARFDPARPERTFGIHKRFSRVESAREPFGVDIGGAHLGHDRARGQLAGGGHDVRWELRWDPAPHPLRTLPDLAYRFGIGDTAYVTPNPRVALTGTVVVDGETLVQDGALAGQSHVWGTKHAYTWAWAHAVDLAGASALELIATRLHRRGLTLPPMLMVVLELDGELYRWNQFRHFVRNRASWRTGRIELAAWSPFARLEGELTCAPDALVQAEYDDPDGQRLYCANTEIGDARLLLTRRGRAPLELRGRAHFETGGRTRDPAVACEHVLVT